jgi:peptide-methionine (S)-S-oxide reductase
MDVAIFGAGCFWGVQASFDKLEGINETEVGYSGGHKKDPTYKDVCTDRTGHAEVVKVVFDPSVISYKELVDHFFSIHDPTTLNRQGPDHGSQYRSVIFFTSSSQEKIAKEARDRWGGSDRYPRPIVTEITEAGPFYKAEEYHQKYFEKNGYVGCH